jgi:site-specific DNA recombinase
MKRAIIYARVSTEEQGDNYSLGSQEDACRSYAGQHGFAVVASFQDMMSGAKLERPGLSRVRELVRAKAIDVVIVYSSDRLTRSVAHAMLLRDEMKTAGVALHTVTRGMSQDSPEGGLMETIEAAFAEYERLKIAERMQRGQRQRIISKLSHGNKLPFGYRYADDERIQIAVNEEEAAVVRTIFNWYLTEPIGSMQIANRLTELRLPSPADRKSYFAVLKKRGRGEWSQSSVIAIIQHISNQMSVWRVSQKATMSEKRLCVAGGNRCKRVGNGSLQCLTCASGSSTHRLLDLGECQFNRR